MESMETGSPVSARSKSALSPSDNMARRASRNSRVHFDEDGYIPQLQEANPIQVQVVGEERSKTVAVYIGFLQEEHKYEVRVKIPSEMCQGYLLQENNAENISINPFKNGQALEESSDGSAKAKLELVEKGNFCDVSTMEWKSSIEGKKETGGLDVNLEVTVPSIQTLDGHNLFEDNMRIRGSDRDDRFIRLKISAKVMGKTMGTPSLKDGIKCIGLCPDPRGSDSSGSSDEEEGK